MSKMKNYSYFELSSVFRENGWHEISSKGKGSHRKWTNGSKSIFVPYHEIQAPVAKRFLKEAGISNDK